MDAIASATSPNPNSIACGVVKFFIISPIKTDRNSEALETVTKYSEDEGYEDFIKRSLGNDIGRKVIIADLREKLDVTRIGKLSEKDIKRIYKYNRALKTLTERQ